MFDDNDGMAAQFQATDYNDTKDKNSGHGTNDGNADDNDATDVLCALCDDGGKLLSCIGQCKRSFHPRKKDGRESKCKTLGYTSEELKRIGSYLCRNCEYKKHQCFKCGGLEPSDEPNAKVFKCKNSSCGHFYHPKCVAKLLEPEDTYDDENCDLAKRIVEGLPFTCPVHWCYECGRMEDRTHSALQFAVCRRCPKSYHRECLPRDISFDTKDKQVKQRAWELSDIIMIYCLDHKICKATGNAKRDHIKFPIMPEISEVSNVCEKKIEMTGKRKNIIGQRSTKSVRDTKRERNRPQNETSSQTMSNIVKKCILPSEGMFDHSVQQDTLLKKPSLDKYAELENEIRKTPEDKDDKQKEKSYELNLGKVGAINNVTTRENEQQNDVPRKLFVENHAEQNQIKSREKRILVQGENEDGIDGCNSVSEQEGDTYMSENNFCHRPNGQGSKSEVKTARIDSTKSFPDNADVPPEKQLIVRHVHKTTEKIDHQPDYNYNEDGQVLNQGNACQEKPNNSHCSGNSKASDIDVSDNQSSKINDFKRNVTDVKNTELKKNQTCIGDGRADHYGDTNHQHPSKLHAALMRVREKYPSQLKEQDHMDLSNRKSEDNSLHCDDENRVAETSGCKTGQGTGSSRREDLTCRTKEDSSNPMGRNVQKKSMNHEAEVKRSYCDMYDQNSGNNNQNRYEHQYQVNYSTNGNYDSKRWDNMQSAVTPTDFGAGHGQWHGPFPYPGGPEHGITGWRSPPFQPSTGYYTGTWHSPPFYPRRPEHPDYTMYQNNFSNFNHGEYHAMGIDPASRYFPRVNNNGSYQPHIDFSVQGHGAMYGGSTCDYGMRSNYAFGWGHRTPASGSVTNRYAPHLEQTNYQPRHQRTMF